MRKQFLSLLFICASLFAFGTVQAQHVHTKSYAAMDEKGVFVPYEFDRQAVGDDDILIDILYSGICHSDIHTALADWGKPHYPCVPGHEIVGRVSQTGKNVTKFRTGDYAGVGCMVGSCGECEHCKAGEEQFCNQVVWTYDSPEDGGYTKGGYSTNIVVSEKFAIKVPENVPLEKVAPLLCAGVTTYSPLKYNQVKKGDKVAVAGYGGLGHMAVQYAIAMGADVTVFDITEDKRQAAFDMGATKYVNTLNEDEMKEMGNSFNLIISTIPGNFKVEPYLSMLKVDGTLVLLGVPAWNDRPQVHTGYLGGRRKIYGSLIGGIRETQEMLDYSVRNGIYSKVVVIPADKITEAYQNIIDGKVQFRYVIDVSTMK